MSNICFYVYAPLYQKNSNGIRMLYTLSEIIRQCGYDSKVICYENERADYDLLMPTRYKHHTLKLTSEFSCYQLGEQDIVIYPDTISDNPLDAKNVVRYLLNRPAYITGKGIDYGDRDYLVSYSLLVDSNLPQLFILNDDREYFYPHDFNEKESVVCIYHGKIIDKEIRDPAIIALIKTFDQTVTITREFPATKIELGDLLRRARLLISLDPISNITYEATLCGTPALIVNDLFNFSSQKFNITLHGIFSNPTRYDEAIKDTKVSFPQYQVVLEGNERNVKLFLGEVIEHFELLNCELLSTRSQVYNRLLARLNSSQRELDELRFSVYTDSTTFQVESNYILTLFGQFLKKLLTEIGFKNNFVSSYTHFKQWIKNEKNILARFFYRV
jgi:hypothetical protein